MRREKRSWLRFVIGGAGVLGTVLSIMSQTPVSIAATNLGSWFEFAKGVAPSWLFSAQTNAAASWIGAVLMLAVGAYYVARLTGTRPPRHGESTSALVRPSVVDDDYTFDPGKTDWSLQDLCRYLRERHAVAEGTDYDICEGLREKMQSPRFHVAARQGDHNNERTWSDLRVVVPADWRRVRFDKLSFSQAAHLWRTIPSSGHPTLFDMRVWSKQIQREWPPAAATVSMLPSAARLADRDSKLVSGLRYIAVREWADDLWENMDGRIGPVSDALADFHQAAADGRVRVWGRRERNYGVQVPIEPTFWREGGTVDLMALFETPPKATFPERGYRIDAFYDLMISRAEFEGVWPK